MEIILATKRWDETDRIRSIFNGFKVPLKNAEEAGITGVIPHDERLSPQERVETKAFSLHAWLAEKKWIIANETGIFTSDPTKGFIECAFSAEEETRAFFRTYVFLLGPRDEKFFFISDVPGTLYQHPHCEPWPNVPCSACFQPDGKQKVWAEMGFEEETETLFRPRAFYDAKEFLNKYHY